MRTVRTCVRSGLWVMALASGAAALAQPGPPQQPQQLQGLYLMTRFMGGSLEMKSWYFKGGRFAQDPRQAAADPDFAAIEQLSPGTTGTVQAQGDQWTFSWTSGRSKTARHEPGKGEGGCFYWDMGLYCPVAGFKPGQLLDGTYSGSIGSGQASASRSYTFTPDGRYRVSTTGAVSAVGTAGAVHGGSTTAQAGRYRLRGHVVTFSPDGGAEQSLTAFPYEPSADPGKPARLYVGGFMLKRSAP